MVGLGLARGLKSWCGGIIRQGDARLRAALLVFEICEVSSWAVRHAFPRSTLMSQSLVVRCISSSWLSSGGWLKFDRPRGDDARSPKLEGTPGRPRASSAENTTRKRRETVYRAKYAEQLTFRESARNLDEGRAGARSELQNFELAS